MSSDTPVSNGDLPSLLRDYQRAGVSFLVKSESALLADDMGLGKTVQVIVALRVLLSAKSINRALVVMPKALLANWEDEFDRWAPDLLVTKVIGGRANRAALYSLPVPILLATYEQVRSDANELNDGDCFDVVVLDEAQRIKQIASRTSLACRSIPRQRSWALTGTPIENRADDLVSLFAFIRQGFLSRGMNLADLRADIQPYFLRRTKAEELPELPKIILQDLPLELHGEQQQSYLELWHQRTNRSPNDHGNTHLLSLITKLKQLCNRDVQSDQSVKAEALNVLLESATCVSDKIIVFSQYVETLRWLSGRLALEHRLYSGELRSDERQAVLRWFKKEPGPSVLLMSLKAGGVGLNLQEASMVVLFDRWWNPATERQAIDRAHRFGRTGTLHAVRFIVRETIEERIEELLSRKAKLFETYIDDAVNAKVSRMTEDDLRSILDLPAIAKQ